MKILTFLFLVMISLTAFPLEKKEAFPVRGICISSPEKKNVQRFAGFIEKELATRGVNTLVLMVNYNFKFESHPEMADPQGMDKDDARMIAKVCKKYGIALIPQINLLGHQSWETNLTALLRVHPEFDETPQVKLPEKYEWPNSDGLYCKSYCPLHPDVHAFVFDLVDEVCDAFDADAFHAGMDEVFYIGESQCPRCAGKDRSELFAGEVKAIHDHLALKHRKMWMWGDRLIDGKTTGIGEWEASENDTYRAIDMIPKDITICDWHYERPDQTPVYFAVKGFNVVTCPWRNPETAIKQAQDMVKFRNSSTPEMKDRFQGIMETVWFGADSFMDGFNSVDPESHPAKNVKCFIELFEEITRLSDGTH
jgi:hypothetical protein